MSTPCRVSTKGKAFELLFDAPSLKLLAAINPNYAIQVCVKMLGIKNLNRTEAVLVVIQAAGIDPWAIAAKAPPRLVERLVALGVRPDEAPAHRFADSHNVKDRIVTAVKLAAFPESTEALATLLVLAGDESRGVRLAAARSLGAFWWSPEALATSDLARGASFVSWPGGPLAPGNLHYRVSEVGG